MMKVSVYMKGGRTHIKHKVRSIQMVEGNEVDFGTHLNGKRCLLVFSENKHSLVKTYYRADMINKISVE